MCDGVSKILIADLGGLPGAVGAALIFGLFGSLSGLQLQYHRNN